MNVVPLLVLCSLVLGAAGVLCFLYSTKNLDHEHVDRLALLPLEDDLVRHDGAAIDPDCAGSTEDPHSSNPRGTPRSEVNP